MAPTGGLGAALIINAEMAGLAAFKLTALSDSHYLSAEMMIGAYSKIMSKHGLSDLKDLASRSKFRELLKEANQRSNTIFS